MSRLHKAVFIGLFFVLLPATAQAQVDLCIPGSPTVPAEARAEQLRIEATERAQRESDRRAWQVLLYNAKNLLPDTTLRALCIFRVEVTNQPALRLVQVRAPKELMSAVEDALKRLDVPPVPPPVPKGIELTGYVIIAMEPADPQMQPLPSSLQPVVNELKSILPNGTLGLADTFVARTVERSSVQLGGSTNVVIGNVMIREGSGPQVIHLSNLQVRSSDSGGNTIGSFQTSVDVPVGTHVVIGRATPARQGPIKAMILVINGKILN
jgi:hypothetical protein